LHMARIATASVLNHAQERSSSLISIIRMHRWLRRKKRLRRL